MNIFFFISSTSYSHLLLNFVLEMYFGYDQNHPHFYIEIAERDTFFYQLNPMKWVKFLEKASVIPSRLT